MNVLIRFLVFFLILSFSRSGLNAQWVKANDTGNGRFPALAANGSTVLAGDYGAGIFRSTDDGASWTLVNNGLTGYGSTTIAALIYTGSEWMAGTHWGGVFRSIDDGLNWSPVNTGLTNKDVTSFAVSGATVFAGTLGGGVFVSTDGGAGWTKVNTGLPRLNVISLGSVGLDLYAGIEAWGIFRSTNGGASWSEQTSDGFTVYSIIPFPPGGSSSVLAGSSGGVFLTTDGGISWTPINDGLANTTVGALAASGTYIFAGTSAGGVYRANDAGAWWNTINTGLPQFPYIYSLVESGPYLIAGTSNTGVWRRPLAEVITSAEGPAAGLPVEFELGQNYPNPFNPTTQISYQLPSASDVQLRVYDALGREVATLVDERKSPGIYDVTFDAAGLASGTYYYRLIAGDVVVTRTMLLLR